MIPSIEPGQTTAFVAWVLQCLNRDDESVAIAPAPFSEASIRWGASDHPRPASPFVLLAEVSNLELAPPEKIRRTVDEGLPTEELEEYTRQISEWTVRVMLGSKISDTSPDFGQAAARILRRLTMRVEGEESNAMRALGLAWTRSSQIIDLTRLAKGSQWETRAAVDLTFFAGEAIVDRPGWIESTEVTGTASPLPAETFTADDDDDLTQLPS